jgi:hypothetical protein
MGSKKCPDACIPAPGPHNEDQQCDMLGQSMSVKKSPDACIPAPGRYIQNKR